MSYAQFSEMLTCGMNNEGAPCTIKCAEGTRNEECPYTDTIEEFRNVYKDTIKNTTKQLSDVRDMIDELINKKGSITKNDIKKLKDVEYQGIMNMQQNIPYMVDTWNKHLEKALVHVETDLEGFVTYSVAQLGLNSIQNFKKPELLP